MGKRGSVGIYGEFWAQSIQRVRGGVYSHIMELNMNNDKRGDGFGLIRWVLIRREEAGNPVRAEGRGRDKL